MSKYPDLVESTGYGTMLGLLGIHCYHKMLPFVDGVSKRNYTDKYLEELHARENTPKEYKGKQYTSSQARDRKRVLETTIRRQKDRVMMFNKAKNDEALQNELIKLQTAQREYNSFCKAMGTKKEPNRTSVVGFGKASDYIK